MGLDPKTIELKRGVMTGTTPVVALNNIKKNPLVQEKIRISPSMGIVVVDIRGSKVGDRVAPQIRRIMEVTNLPVELWVSKSSRKENQEVFQGLNSTGRLFVRTMTEKHVYKNMTIDLQGKSGGRVGKAYALKESNFDYPFLFDGDVWVCNDDFAKELHAMLVNGNTDVVWTLAPLSHGGTGGRAITSFVDPRIADHFETYKTFRERNTGTLVAVRRNSPAVQSWLELTLDIYTVHVKSGEKILLHGINDQPSFRDAFFIHRHNLTEHLLTDAHACRAPGDRTIFNGEECKQTCYCLCTSCSLVHNGIGFDNCFRYHDYAGL